ncbi:MAG: bifunctional serine/threonine-protein kinase/formylglycine-generating enzyme family protein [Leptolyngbyaceae bacterium]|nr:bifunctional serine/threonine-protein kinase/formylglycine-generating enzyme family protein [Leptolyngbyaceae bacterium]
MSYCLNPACQQPQNLNPVNLCQSCGSKLLLKERYRALRPIGKGGFGRTFVAVDEDKPSKPRCVIKQFFYQDQNSGNVQQAAKLFETEAIRLEELGEHPQIPRLLAHSRQDNQQYLVQEFIDGQNLEEELKATGVFSPVQIRKLLLDLLPVLKFVHDNQVVHRDIKPANLMHRRSDHQLFLVDFGASRFVTETVLAKTGTKIYSLGFAAPEQERGKATFASDLYSLGVTCITLLTRIHPWDLFDSSEDTWAWRQKLKSPISDGLGRVIDKMLERATSRRYRSAEEILEDLNPQAVQFPPSPPPSVAPLPSVGIQSTSPMLLELTQLQPATDPSSQRANTFTFETVTLTIEQKQGFFAAKNKVTLISHSRSGQAEFFVEQLGNGVVLEMVSIPGGTFIMGSSSSEEGHSDDESPQHPVTIPNFFMGKFTVTQAQFGVVMGFNDSHFTENGANRPVERVSWNDAQEFCRRLSQITGRIYRLPSEAEWEYACRSGTKTPFYVGETLSSDLANYNGNSIYGAGVIGKYQKQTTVVGSFPPNGFGLYDMHGNVWEWCQDTWHVNYEGAATDGSAWDNDNSSQRLLRGGSWDSDVRLCRSAKRYSNRRDSRYNNIGFRVFSAANPG